MSATIYTNSSTASKRIQLSNGQMARRMIYLNNWTTIRIGLRLTVPSAANIVGTPRLWVGVGSGTAAAVGDAITTNFIGLYTSGATWSRLTNVSPAIAYCVTTGRPVKKVGATITDTGANFSNNITLPLSDTFLSLILLEITKGSPNYTIIAGMATSITAFNGVALPGITEAQMDQYMTLPIGMTGITTVTNAGYNVATSQNLAMSEVAGNLDAVQVYWDKTAANCEIESVYHRKLA